MPPLSLDAANRREAVASVGSTAIVVWAWFPATDGWPMSTLGPTTNDVAGRQRSSKGSRNNRVRADEGTRETRRRNEPILLIVRVKRAMNVIDISYPTWQMV